MNLCISFFSQFTLGKQLNFYVNLQNSTFCRIDKIHTYIIKEQRLSQLKFYMSCHIVNIHIYFSIISINFNNLQDMYSPSAELNAYILDYKAQQSLRNSPFSRSSPTRNLYNADHSLSSKSWLQEVLTMPPEYKNRSRSRNSCSPQTKEVLTSPDESAVDQWLNKIDEKISKRFPKVNSSPTKMHQTAENNCDETTDSDKTLELIMADPKTGCLSSCHCASYDSHPNASRCIEPPDNVIVKEEEYCNCSDLRGPAWVDDVINENICSICIGKDHELTCYHPQHKEQSVDLPDGYKLFDSKLKTKSEKLHRRSKSKKKEVLCVEQKFPLLNETSNSQRISPETENIMKLLERAINQLQDVKGAVEENTVSAITSDISTTSQALSELPVD